MLFLLLLVAAVAAIALNRDDVQTEQAAPGEVAAAFDYSPISMQGPQYWHTLSPLYSLCSSGGQQSPVDINQSTLGSFVSSSSIAPNWEIIYNAVLINEHSTLKLKTESSSFIDHRSVRFVLQNIHFHSSTEHSLFGAKYAIEMHMVHKSADGKLLVVAGLITQTEATDAFLVPILNAATRMTRHPDDTELVPAVYLPVLEHWMDNVYEYEGSLTVPPCTEGVVWLIAKGLMGISQADHAGFDKLVYATSRPLQRIK